MGVYKFMAYWINEVPDHLTTQEMCIEAVKGDPWQLEYVPDHFKTQEMCNKAVKVDSQLLNYVPDWFLTHQQVKIWHNDAYYCNDDELIEWYNGYQKCKAQKAKLKDKVMPIA